MVIIITFAALLAFFFFLRKHTGLAQLAALAGLCIFDFCSREILKFIEPHFTNLPKGLLDSCLFLVLIAVPALLLYFCASRGGLFGPMRIIMPVIAAVLFTTILIPVLSYFFALDGLSSQIDQTVHQFETLILLAGFATALIDIALQPRHQ